MNLAIREHINTVCNSLVIHVEDEAAISGTAAAGQSQNMADPVLHVVISQSRNTREDTEVASLEDLRRRVHLRERLPALLETQFEAPSTTDSEHHAVERDPALVDILWAVHPSNSSLGVNVSTHSLSVPKMIVKDEAMVGATRRGKLGNRSLELFCLDHSVDNAQCANASVRRPLILLAIGPEATSKEAPASLAQQLAEGGAPAIHSLTTDDIANAVKRDPIVAVGAINPLETAIREQVNTPGLVTMAGMEDESFVRSASLGYPGDEATRATRLDHTRKRTKLVVAMI
jgi:hypothetical protein